MATTLICGFGLGSLGELSISTSAGFSISSTVFRSGKFSLRSVGDTVGTSALQKRSAGGALIAIVQSFRFYLRVDAYDVNFGVGGISTSTTTAGTSVSFGAGGVVTISDGAGGGSVSGGSPIPAGDGQFHRVDVDVSGTTRTVYVDGVLAVQSTTGGTAAAQTTVTFGQGGNGGDCYFADLLCDDGSIGAPVSGANNMTALLIPTAGNNAGSWTDGAGGTGNISGSVKSIPPVGVAAATAAAKIKNAVSGTALDYIATIQTYLVGGIPPGSKINAIQAICNDGEEITTGTKSGGIWCASNPAQSAVVIGTGVGFDYGDDTATVVGTFPTGWATHFGIVAVNPAVTLSTAPTVTVRKGSSTTRVVDVDFMGLYVDYTPPPIGKANLIQQAVNRASVY